jgi:hypothetical protein
VGHTHLIREGAVGLVEGRGARFLLQDPATGHWLVMTPKRRDDHVHLVLTAGTTSSSLLGSLKQELDFLQDRYRFGFRLRNFGALKRLSLTRLMALSDKIFSVPGGNVGHRRTQPKTTTNPAKAPARAFQFSAASSNQPLPYTSTKLDRRKDQENAFHLLQEVTYISPTDGTPTDVTIIGMSDTRNQRRKGDGDNYNEEDEGDTEDGEGVATYDVAVYGEASYDMGSVLRGVSGNDLFGYLPLTEGDPVLANYRGRGNYFPGVAIRVLPNEDIHVAYNDGDVEYFVSSSRYRMPLE